MNMFEFQQLVSDVSTKLNNDEKNLIMSHAKNLTELYSDKKYPAEHTLPVGCQLELTHACNLKCLHCYNCSGKVRRELSIKQWIKVAKELVKMEIFECVISGGSPLLLGKDLFKIMDILHDGGVSFIFITNGFLVTKSMISKLSKYEYSWFQTSIDGSCAEIHDKIRGVKGSWERATAAASIINELGLPLVIAHTIMRQNFDSMQEAFENFYALGASRVVTGKFIYSGRAIINRKKIELTKRQENNLKSQLEIARRRFSKKMEVISPLEPSLYLRLRIIEPSEVILIRPNGDVKLDCVLPFKIGNVKNGSLADMWQNIGKNAWRRQEIIDWIKSISSAKDMLSTRPRPYVDKDMAL